MTEARTRRLRPRVRFGVESLEARFLLNASGTTDPKAGVSPIAPPLVVMVASPPEDAPSTPPRPDPGPGATSPAAPTETAPGPSPVLWVVNPAPDPSDVSGPTSPAPGATAAPSSASGGASSGGSGAVSNASLLTSILGAASAANPPIQPVALIPVPTIPTGTGARDRAGNAGNGAARQGDASAGDKLPPASPTGVFGVLDTNHNWTVYQLSIDPNGGTASVTQTASGAVQRDVASSLPGGDDAAHSTARPTSSSPSSTP